MAKARKTSDKGLKDLKSKTIKSAGRLEADSVRGGLDADAVRGGRKAGKGQQEFLLIKTNDVIITS
jgi:hypothetical protein